MWGPQTQRGNLVTRALGTVREGFGPAILLGGLAVLVLVVSLGFWAFLGPVIGVVLGGLASLFIREYDFRNTAHAFDWRIGVAVTAFYVIGVIVSYRFASGPRPPVHYAIHGAMVAFITVEILRGQRRRLVVPEMLVLLFFAFWSSQFAFPAGMYAPDTFSFMREVRTILEVGSLAQVSLYGHTPGHMVYVAAFARVTGLSVDLAYRLSATLAVTGTVLVLSYSDLAIPSLSRTTALLSTLVFATMSYTLAKGGHPTKLNYFYPLVAMIVLIVIKIETSDQQLDRYVAILGVVMTYLVFGHTYSSGAALMAAGAVWVYFRGVPFADNLDYAEPLRGRRSIVFIALCIAFLAYSIFVTGEMSARIGSIVTSLTDLFGSSSGGSGGGRYSNLPLGTLFAATSAQLVMFVVSMLGLSMLVRRRKIGFDAVTFWVVSGFSVLAFSIFGNATDIPPQRIYSLLALFGLNIAAAVGILALRSKSRNDWPAVVVLAILAILSLSSPVAGVGLSPYSDDIPAFRDYRTVGNNEVTNWIEAYAATDTTRTTTNQVANVPTEPLEPSRVSTFIDRSAIATQTLYVYSQVARESGLLVDGSGATLGSRRYAFVHPPDDTEIDDTVYDSGKATVYRRRA